jgi:hypothetical protein
MFSPLLHSKSVMEEDEMEDAPLLSLLAEGCEGSEFAEGGTVRPGLEPCAGCGLLMNHDYYCVGCGKSIHWFCSEGDVVLLLKHLGLIQIQTLYSNCLTMRCGQLEER